MADASSSSNQVPATDGPIIGLNIREEATSRSAILGVLPRGAVVEIGEKSTSGKWGRIANVTQGEIAAARIGGTVHPSASRGWVYLPELEVEGNEPQVKDSVYVLPRPYPTIKAGDLVGHIGEYQRYRDASPMPPTAKRPLLHLEIFSGDKLPGFIDKSRARAEQLPADQKTILVINKGAHLVTEAAPPAQVLNSAQHLRETSDSPKSGLWAKAQTLSASIKPSSALTGYNAKNKSYANGDVFEGHYVGATDTDIIDERTYAALSNSAKHAYSRRQVLSPESGAPVWVRRDQLSSSGGASTWTSFPLQISNARGQAVGFTFTISRETLDALPASAKAVDDKGVHWWQVSLGAEGGSRLSGWVCEKDHPNTQWQSPWAWPGFELVDATSISIADLYKRFLSVTGTASATEVGSFKPSVATVAGSDLITKLEQAVDAQGDKDGTITAKELKAAQQQAWLAQAISHIIVKYESEWGGDMGRWEQLSSLMGDRKSIWQGELRRIEKLRWWDNVGAVGNFPGDSRVHHIHPIGLVQNFFCSKSCCEITLDFMEKILDKPGDWFTGKGGSPTFVREFPTTYPKIYNFNKQDFVNLLNAALKRYGITECYQKAHFLSQAFLEVARFETTVEFASGNAYNPGVHPRAEENGNTQMGDGPKYRGRGLLQLTWKNNYKSYSAYRGVDFVASPDLLATDMNNAIDSACWYWRYNGTVQKKYNAKGDINVLVKNDPDNVKLITLGVNGGSNGLDERQRLFDKIKKEWGLK